MEFYLTVLKLFLLKPGLARLTFESYFIRIIDFHNLDECWKNFVSL